MEKLYIFKYTDVVDGHSAFIIHEKEEEARDILMKETTIEVLLSGTRLLEDIPRAQEHWFNSYNHIYINKILPF